MKKLTLLILLLFAPLCVRGQSFQPHLATKVVFTGATASTTNIVTMSTIASGAYNLVWPATAGTNLYVLQTDGSGNLSWVAQSGGMANVLTTTGDMVYSSSGSTPARLAVGGTGTILSVAGGIPAWTTTTIPATTTVNQILYSSSASVLGGITTANNEVLGTNGSGVPAFSTTLGSAVTASSLTSFGSTPTIVTPSITTGFTIGGTAASGTIPIGNGTNFVASTATYPATTTINQILYSSSASVIGGITTANNELLGTNGSGVPSFLTAVPSAVTSANGVTSATALVTVGALATGSLANGFTESFMQFNELTPSGLGSSNVPNYAITTTNSFQYLSSGAAINLSGIVAGSDGMWYVLINNGTNNITLTNEDAASTAANRFHFGAGNIILAPDGCIMIVYDNTSTNKRWRKFPN